MPDVSRSDSQLSDSSRPRVSFNRDVHVKRIGNGSAPRVVGALAGDASGRLQSLAVRRERPTRLSRQALAKEAHKVLQQADSVQCSSTSLGLPPLADKFNTVPARRKKHNRPLVAVPSPGATRKRARVTRSNSDAANQKSDEDRTKFWSLDRLRSKKNTVKVTQSDTEAPVIPSILSKKSHSDTEKRTWKNSDSEASSAKKKQLSPIIEATPRDDYFQSVPPDGVVHNNKTLVTTKNKINQISPKVPSRSRKVKTATPTINIQSKDSRVYKGIDVTPSFPPAPVKMETMLHSSQTITKPILTRGRTVDSMVRKLSQDRAGRGPPRVVSPLGLGTPGDERKHNNNLPFSYTEPPYLHEDRFGGLIERDLLLGGGDSGLPTRPAKLDLPTSPTAATLQGDAQQVIYAEVVCNGGGNGVALTKQTVHTSVSQLKEDLADSAKPEVMEYVSEYRTNLGDYSSKEARRVESRGRADGMDARRNVQEEYRRSSPVRRNLMDDFEDVIEPVIKPWNDLSSRRDRLESRIESQRKDRLMSSRLNDKAYVNRRNDAAVIDNARKYPSNPRLDSDYSRREFLNSQLTQEKNKDTVDFGRSVDNIDKHAAAASTAVVGKDKFTDSGIDIDYHNDMAANYPAGSKIITEVRSYHNQHERKSITPSVKYKSQPTLTNITKVDVNGHVQPGSDEEDDDDENEMFFYNQQENVDQIRAKRALKEAGKPADVLPPSSVLIRNYATGQNGVDKKEDGYRRRRGDERRDMDDDYTKRKSCLLSDAEESRRFIVEERRKMVDERAGVECARLPEKVKKRHGPMDIVRALFARGGETKKKTVVAANKKAADEEVDQLRARYTEYRGTEVQGPRAPSRLKNQGHTESTTLTRTRRERLATPSPSPSRPSSVAAPVVQSNGTSNGSSGWFKSLDRLTSRKKTRAKMQQSEVISESDESKPPPPNNKYNSNNNNNNSADRGNKNLRFFGDTDAESVRSHGAAKPTIKLMATLAEHPTPAQQTRYVPLRDASNRRYKSTNKLQVPRRRHHRSAGELATSSAESTTEGDSSQQSQRSVVYLHAATVGDIPGRTPSRTNRRARSREELSSTTGSNLTPQTRTVSRSISVLAPWKPRHYREGMEVHYENDSDKQLRATKPPKVPTNYKTSSSTLNRIKNNKEASAQHKSYNSLKRDSRIKDKENRKSSNSLSRNEYNRSSDSLHENGKRLGNGLNMSVGELSNGYRNGATTLKKNKPSESERKRTELARSMSMPKDSKVKSGWFRLRKK